MPFMIAGIVLIIFVFVALSVLVTSEFIIGAVALAVLAVAGWVYLLRARPR